MSRRLRIAHVMIQPVLVWDDGDNLEDGPPIEVVKLPLSKVPDMLAALPNEVAALAARLNAEGMCAVCLDRGELRTEGHDEPCIEAPPSD